MLQITRTIQNPAVQAEAELFTDGTVTDRLLRDMATMRNCRSISKRRSVTRAQPSSIPRRRRAEGALRTARRVYLDARRGIGDANRTRTAPVIAAGRVVMPARSFIQERIRERKSAALRLFNRRCAELRAAEREFAAVIATASVPLALVA